jgi:hypothetical protein
LFQSSIQQNQFFFTQAYSIIEKQYKMADTVTAREDIQTVAETQFSDVASTITAMGQPQTDVETGVEDEGEIKSLNDVHLKVCKVLYKPALHPIFEPIEKNGPVKREHVSL